MLRKIVWSALLTAATSLAMALTYRAAAAAWRRVRHEEPPPLPGWAKFLVGKPVKKGLFGRLRYQAPA